MKGLIYKDYYCMKKSLLMLVIIIILTVTVAVLFTLSTRYGNISKLFQPGAKNGMTEEEFYYVYRLAVYVTLLIPMAFVGNILDCFRSDHQAGWSKMLCTLPVSETKTVIARYSSFLLYELVGMTGSILSSLVVSAAAKQLKLSELLSVTLTFAGILTIYVSIVIPLVYLFRSNHVDYIQLGVMLVALCGVIYGGIGYVKRLKEEGIMSSDSSIFMIRVFGDVKSLLTEHGMLFLVLGISSLGVSSVASVMIVRRRKGLAG